MKVGQRICEFVHLVDFSSRDGAIRPAAKRVVPSETRRYVQDVRYFAVEHMDVRREAYNVLTACRVVVFAKVSNGTTRIPADDLEVFVIPDLIRYPLVRGPVTMGLLEGPENTLGFSVHGG